ncbi:MAG: S9 family peptidase [Acidimicrobiaceae bacterium]|nr:S9 family peptidase [Acidimicrobiaceae bacterium]
MSNVTRLSPNDFSHLTSLADPQISLDGRYATYLKKANGKSSVIWVDLEDPSDVASREVAVRPAHPFGGGVTQLSGDGQTLYFATLSGGITRMDLVSGRTSDIYNGPGVSQISLSLDQSRIGAVVFGDRVALFDTSGGSEPYVVSEYPRELRPFSGMPATPGYFVFGRPDYVFDVSLSPTGKQVIWHEWALPNMAWQRSQIAYLDLDTKVGDSLIDICAGGDYFVSQPRFSPDGDRMAFLAEVSGFLRLWTADITHWSAELAVDEKFEHGGAPWGNGNRTFDFSTDGKRIYFSRNEAGHGRLLELNLETSRVSELAKAHHFGIKSSNSSLIAVRSGAKTPNVIVSYDLENGKRFEIDRAYGERFYSAVSTEPILGIAPYSTSLHGYVKPQFKDEIARVEPLGIPYRLFRLDAFGADAPTVVTFHGGPTDQALVTYSIRNVAFLQAGYQVLTFDYRGSTGWGKSFREALDSGFGLFEIVDLLTVLSDLVCRDLVNLGSIVVNGGSSGGYSALRSICMTKGLFCGAIAVYPLVDLAESVAATHRFESRYFDSLVGSLPNKVNLYRQRSLRAGELDAIPLLLMHGDSDPVVDHRQVVRFVEEAQVCGKQIKFMLFPGEGHGFTSADSLFAEFGAYEEFLGQIYKPGDVQGS